jgi:cytochrome c
MHPNKLYSDTNNIRERHNLARAAVVLLLSMSSLALADTANGQPWGYDTPAGTCVVCHSLEEGGPFRVAPNLWGIVGAEKARDRAWYAYSPALIKLGGTWTIDELNAFLADPDSFLPGTKKSIKVEDDLEREQIIDFLSQLKD